jgi:hypothetical protein
VQLAIPIEGNHVLGDILITKKDQIFISDSGIPVIYKVQNGKLEEWINLEKEAYNL